MTHGSADFDPTRGAAVITEPVARGGLPARVHVFEDYETDIERRWWLAGKLETKNVPPGSTRACRGVLSRDFDDQHGSRGATYRAVIFNPVPGPPMGPNTRLSFRYRLQGTDRLRVQIYSLTNGYHRHLVLTGLPQGQWQEATVDMTAAAGPTAAAARLAADERIDDIQFYVDPAAELLIDDIVLYEAAEAATAPFPQADPVHRLVRHRQARRGVARRLRDRAARAAAEVEGGSVRRDARQ